MQVKLGLDSNISPKDQKSEECRVQTQQTADYYPHNNKIYQLSSPDLFQNQESWSHASQALFVPIQTQQTQEMSEFSWIIHQGLERARIQSKRQQILETLTQEYKINLQIEIDQCYELQCITRNLIIEQERQQLQQKIHKIQSQIKNLRKKNETIQFNHKNSAKSYKTLPAQQKSSELHDQTIIHALNELVTTDMPPQDSIDQKKMFKKMPDREEDKKKDQKVIVFNRNRSRNSRMKERSLFKSNMPEHRKILIERAKLVIQYNGDLLQGFLRRIEKMEFENSLLRRQLDLIVKEINNFSVSTELRKRKPVQQQHIGLNRTPRYMSQNYEKKTAQVKNQYEKKQRNRVLALHRDGLLNSEKRSLSKNSARSNNSIKNRTRSSYSNRGLIVSKDKNDKNTLKRHPQFRGEYFHQERKNSHNKPFINNE